MFKYILLVACATVIGAEEKWAWSSSNRNRNENHRNDDTQNDRRYDRIDVAQQNRKERLEDLQDRYEVIEPTTKRPIIQKPQQDDEYFGGSELGNPNTQRFNFNGLGGGGVYQGGGGYQSAYPQGAYPQGGYPQGVGGYPTAFNVHQGPIRGQFQPNLYGNNFGPSGGGHYPGNIGGNLGPIGHSGPNHGIHSGQVGVLVGPGGPTGIIGRPGYGPNRAHPANGVLVGPGGPTGIIGRPTGPSGLHGGFGGANGYGGPGIGGYGPLGGHVPPGVYNGIGGGIGGGVGGPFGGPAVGIPYNSGAGARPYAAEFDDYDNGLDKNKRVEKKSIDIKN